MLHLLRPSHSHTAYTATVLLMVSAVLSRLMGLVRVKYIALVFGRGMEADAFIAAFQLPDMIAIRFGPDMRFAAVASPDYPSRHEPPIWRSIVASASGSKAACSTAAIWNIAARPPASMSMVR